MNEITKVSDLIIADGATILITVKNDRWHVTDDNSRSFWRNHAQEVVNRLRGWEEVERAEVIVGLVCKNCNGVWETDEDGVPQCCNYAQGIYADIKAASNDTRCPACKVGGLFLSDGGKGEAWCNKCGFPDAPNWADVAEDIKSGKVSV